MDVGQLIAVTVEKGMDWKQAVVPQELKVTPSVAAPATVAKPSVKGQCVLSFNIFSSIEKVHEFRSTRIYIRAYVYLHYFYRVYGLAVKLLLEEYGLDPNSIKGTGRPNRILKSDVLAYIQANNIKKVQLKTGEYFSKLHF